MSKSYKQIKKVPINRLTISFRINSLIILNTFQNFFTLLKIPFSKQKILSYNRETVSRIT